MFHSSSVEILLDFSKFYSSLLSTLFLSSSLLSCPFFFIFHHLNFPFTVYSETFTFYLYLIHLFALYISLFYILIPFLFSRMLFFFIYFINAVSSLTSLSIMMLSFLIFSSACTDCFLHLADFVVCLELLLHASGFLQTSRNLGLPVHI